MHSTAVEKYLKTLYRPDCDYVDGFLLDRHVGEKTHAKAQQEILLYLHHREALWNIFVIQAQRIRISSTHYRVPDVCVVAGPEPDEQIFTNPPFVCIEILSPQDRAAIMLQKISDYLNFGVPYVWVVDPWTRKAWIYTSEQMREVKDGLLRTANPDIEVPFSEIFLP